MKLRKPAPKARNRLISSKNDNPPKTELNTYPFYQINHHMVTRWIQVVLFFHMPQVISVLLGHTVFFLNMHPTREIQGITLPSILQKASRLKRQTRESLQLNKKIRYLDIPKL